MKQSLKQERWQPLPIGEDSNWTTRMINQKWRFKRDTWRMTVNRGEDVRGDLEEVDLWYGEQPDLREQIKTKLRKDRTECLGNFISLEQTLDVCREIWMEKDSGDEADDCE